MARPKSITLAPQALDRNGISTTETLLATRLDFLINGALSTGYDRNGICTAQTTASSVALSIDGALGRDFVSRKGVYVLIYAASADNTGITFKVAGTNRQGAYITETITGPDNGLIVLGAVRFWSITSITPSAAIDGNVEVGVNGYVDLTAGGAAQHVAIYSAGNDSSATILVTGEDRYEDDLTETITGANAGTSSSQSLNFGRVDRLTMSTGSAGAVEAGVDGLCESQWFILNYRGGDFNVALGVDVVTGTLTYAVQHTLHDLMSPTYSRGDETVFTHDTLTGKTTDDDGSYTNPPRAVRLAFTAHTSGSAVLHITQAGS